MREPTACWQYCQNQSMRGYSSSCYTKRGSLKKVLRLSCSFSPWSCFVFTLACTLLSLFPNHQEPGTSYHLSFASFESLGIGCSPSTAQNSYLKTVRWKCNYIHLLNPFPLPTYKQSSCKNATTLPQPLLPLHQQSCENATTLAQPHPPPCQQTVMWECNYTCSAPPTSLSTNSHVRMQLHLLSPTLFPTPRQSCENATTLAQPHPPPSPPTVMWECNCTCSAPPSSPHPDSHVRMQLHLLSPTLYPTSKQSCGNTITLA